MHFLVKLRGFSSVFVLRFTLKQPIFDALIIVGRSESHKRLILVLILSDVNPPNGVWASVN
jgi:hypothetical protein